MKTLMTKLILEEPVDDVVRTILKEDSLTDDEIVTTPEISTPEISTSEISTPPVTEEGFGIASLLNLAIIDEFEAIDTYNSQIATIRDLVSKEKNAEIIATYEDIIEILTEIINEENIHVGQLQKALTLVSPNANLIIDGHPEEQDTEDE